MSSRVREALTDLEDDLSPLRLRPASAVRARGEALRRRQLAGVVAAATVGMAVTAAVAFPLLNRADAPPVRPGAAAVCTPGLRPSATPMPSDRMRVFLSTRSTPAQQAAVQELIDGLPGVKGFTFVSRQQAWASFSDQFRCDTDLLNATRPESLPEAFEVILDDPADFARVRDAVTRQPGVDAVIQQGP